MPDRDPANWNLATWALALIVSSAGGLVNWIGRIRQGHAHAFNLAELAGEMFVSGFVGFLVFAFMHSLGYDHGICAAAAGVSGHMATRLLFLIENLIEDRLLRGMGAKKPPERKP